MNNFYNNIGICAVAIWLTLTRLKKLEACKALLIMPLMTHSELLNYLSHSNADVNSIEELVAKKPTGFTNYNARFYDTLPLSINSIQFLVDIEAVEVVDGHLLLLRELQAVPELGKRANKIAKAVDQISKVLTVSAEALYLNLRVEL